MSLLGVPKEYKQTEVGVIPDDWDVKPLSEFITALEAGVSVNSVERSELSTHDKFILKTSCIFGGYFDPKEAKSILPKDLNRAKLNPRRNSILVSRMNTPALVGEVGFIDDDYANLYLPDRLWQTKYKNDQSVDGKWLSFILSFPRVAKKIKETATGTSNSMKNISKGSFLSVTVPAPKVEEQTAIANTLSDVDALISSLEKLITKKRAIKTAAMQQLLTGKKRLPPFDKTHTGYKQTELGEIPEDWEVSELSQFVENGRLPSGLYKDQSLYGSGTKIIKLGDVFRLDIFDPHAAQRAALTSEEKRVYKVSIGDIFIALASVKLEGVGKVMLVKELDEVTVYDHNVALIRSLKKCDSNYLFYTLKSNAVRSQVKMNATQVGTSFLKASTILSFELPLPSKNEQAVIANVLSDMDKEIEVIEQRLTKTQQLKQGMMQELLTGRTRLI
ncbi:MAG: restriction endonuclease subunit S [Methylomarinum sp.]|nr:restriction endonuclease subunit S [Methylomarinum sp.]